MKAVLVVVLAVHCVVSSNGYFFPICAKGDKSCTDYFAFPSLSFPSLNFGGEEHEEVLENVAEPVVEHRGAVLEHLDKMVAPVTEYYAENVHPFLAPIYETLLQYLSPLKNQCMNLLKYVPFLKYEEKVKADSRLYLLFIVTSLGVYLVLYVYFTKKLCSYYQQNLREQYLNNLKKIFNKGKEE